MNEEKIKIGTKYSIDGLLTIPTIGTAPYPAVVLVHGSGANDMNEKVGNTYTFRDLAEGLSALGIATIRYNMRTFSYAEEMEKTEKERRKKMGKEYNSDFSVKEEKIEDALFATDLLRKDPRINPEKIFILGHSLGGLLAPRIDAEGGNFAGFIIFGASPRKLEEIMIDQQNDYLKTANFFIKWIAKKQFRKLREKFAKMYEMTDAEAMTTPLFGKYSMIYYLKEMGEKPSEKYLENLEKPVLVMQGEADFHVSVEKDFEKYKEILANHSNATFKLYPNLNHLFMPSVYGDIKLAMKEYEKPQKVEEYVINDIAEWIKSV